MVVGCLVLITIGTLTSLPLAWSAQRAHDIVASWEVRGLVPVALRSVGVDYIFIVAYTLFFVCCVWRGMWVR